MHTKFSSEKFDLNEHLSSTRFEKQCKKPSDPFFIKGNHTCAGHAERQKDGCDPIAEKRL